MSIDLFNNFLKTNTLVNKSNVLLKENGFFNFLSDSNYAFMDAAAPWQLTFHDPATPIMEGIINFHNDLMFFITVIMVFVMWVLFRCIHLYSVDSKEVPQSGDSFFNLQKCG